MNFSFSASEAPVIGKGHLPGLLFQDTTQGRVCLEAGCPTASWHSRVRPTQHEQEAAGLGCTCSCRLQRALPEHAQHMVLYSMDLRPTHLQAGLCALLQAPDSPALSRIPQKTPPCPCTVQWGFVCPQPPHSAYGHVLHLGVAACLTTTALLNQAARRLALAAGPPSCGLEPGSRVSQVPLRPWTQHWEGKFWF